MQTFNQPTYEELTNKEWIVTNGIGGYASGTLSGSNSRRYHGLLVASFNPPTHRSVLVAKVQESIAEKGNRFQELSSNQFPGTIHPKGYEFLASFDRKPLPKFLYQVSGHQLSKTIFMVQNSNTTVVEYKNEGANTIECQLTPLFVHRDYHSLFHKDFKYDFFYEKKGNQLRIHSHYGAPALFCKWSKGNFEEDRFWFERMEYEKEHYRGLEYQEDSYAIGHIRITLNPQESVFLTFTTEEKILEEEGNKLKEFEINRIKSLVPSASPTTFYSDLAISADQFIVKRQPSHTYSIIAGYHWFTDWGRDTMIAMRGLCISLNKKEMASSILRTFLQRLSKGMLPNRFPDSGEEPEYNTIDATLWLYVVVYDYFQKFKDIEFVKEIFPKLSEILQAHMEGTRYQIHVTAEGFLSGGEEGVQLTWMDARIGDFVVTPRHGCPVEINALWYNALKIHQFLASELNEALLPRQEDLIKQLEVNFPKKFLNDQGYLNDVLALDGSIDDSIRPNQIYAVSLPFSLLKPKQEKKVFDFVDQHLFTPMGLRSLSPDHADFKPTYGGDQWHRDTAYHQGTVWAFLIGEYILAFLKLNKYSQKAKQEALEKLKDLELHFYDQNCIHGVSEIFDGLNPQIGRGTIQQAWSIGGLIQAFEQIYAK